MHMDRSIVSYFLGVPFVNQRRGFQIHVEPFRGQLAKGPPAAAA